jgi:shikimate kinase
VVAGFVRFAPSAAEYLKSPNHPADNPPVSIVLIGYRGSGKSSVARELAALLHWPWIDTDDLIVQRAGITIREIFAQHGEPHFRDLEADIIHEQVCARFNHILALGGGAILRESTRTLLKDSAHRIFYLHADPQTLHDRIHADPQTQHTRPSLTSLGGDIAEIRSLLAQRLPLYREVMTDEIDVTNKSPREVAEQIKQLTHPDKPPTGLAT